MILSSTTATTPYTPPWRAGQPNAPVFHLRAGSVIERGLMEAELSGPHRAAKVWNFELRAAVESGVRTLLAGDRELDHLLSVVAIEAEEPEQLEAADKRLLGEMKKLLAEHWPEYRDLRAQMERRQQIAPIVALQRFCTGWDNCLGEDGETPAIFGTTREGLVTDDALRGLSPLDLVAAGSRAFKLQFGGGEEKNSPPPPVSAGGLTTSNSDASSMGAGRSKAGTGKRTRARRSPPGSGPSSSSTS